MAETSGSCSVVTRTTSDYGKYNPIQRASDRAKLRKEIKDLKKVSKIESKPPEERSVEEKVFLFNYYAANVLDKMQDVPKKHFTGDVKHCGCHDFFA